MEYTDLIQEYVDGNLSPEVEEQFFMTLSGNEDLRSELRQQLAIKDAIRTDKRAFTPAPESTLKVFSALGFTPPPVAPVPIGTGSALTGVQSASVLTKYSHVILGGLVSAAATAVVVLMLINPMIYGDKNAYTGNNSTTSKIVKQTENISGNNLQANPNTNIAQPPVRTKTIVRYVYVQKQTENPPVSNKQIVDQSMVSNQQVISLSPINEKIGRGNLISAPQTTRQGNMPISFNLQPLSEFIGTDKMNFSVEYMGSAPFNLQKATINPNQYANFNNSQIGLFYNFNDNWSAGLDLRQETFFQSYEGKDGKGQPWRYEQQPNFTSYSATARYKFNEIISWVSPFSQISLGGTNVGFIGRLMVGTEIKPYYGVSFVIGLEYSDLMYKHQTNYFNSGKIGFKYGMGISF